MLLGQLQVGNDLVGNQEAPGGQPPGAVGILGCQVEALVLLQNLLEHLKDIFKEEMPSRIYIKDGEVLEEAPEKVLREIEPDREHLATLHYDNSPPQNPDGSERAYDNKAHNPDTTRYKERTQNRKKNGR